MSDSIVERVEATEGPAEESVRPIPPRYRWLRRIAAAGGVFLLAMIAVRVAWGFMANRRLQEELDGYRAAGQPVTLEDFEAEMAGEENAAPLLIEAARVLPFPQPDTDDYLDLDAVGASLPEVKGLVDAHQTVFDLVERAVRRPAAMWPGTLGAGTAWTLNLSGHRGIAKALRTTILFGFHAGDHEEAIATAGLGVRHGDLIQKVPEFTTALVGMACVGLQLKALEAVLPALVVAGKGPVGSIEGIRAARRDTIRELIDYLADDGGPRRRAVRAVFGGRADTLNRLERVSRVGWLRFLLVGPLDTLDCRWQLIDLTAAACAVEKENWVTGRGCFAGLDQRVLPLDRVLHPYRYLFSSTREPHDLGWRFAIIYFESLARRHMAATALAIRLFEADHGRRPSELDALVPDYLARVPSDPFAEGATIRQAFTSAGHVLYSVGEDGIDDYGADVRATPESRRERAGDMVFHLDGPPRKPGDPNGASAPTADDDGQPEDGRGQNNQKQQGDRGPEEGNKKRDPPRPAA